MTFLRDSSDNLLHGGTERPLADASADALAQVRRASDNIDESAHGETRGRAAIDNAIAYCIALMGDPELLPEGLARAQSAYAALPVPLVAGTLGAILVQTGDPDEGLRLLEHSRPALETPLDVLETERFTVTGLLAKRNVFQARQAFRRGMEIPGVDLASLHRIAPALGAAEASLWLRRFAEGVVPTRDELAEMAGTIGFTLAAWLAPDLDNERRWQLFDAAGGDRSTLTAPSMNSLGKLTNALLNEGARF